MPSLQFLQITTVLIVSIFHSTNAHSFILAIEGSNGQRSTGFGTRLTSRGTLVQNTGIIHTGDMASGQVGPCGRIFGGDGLPASAVDVQKEMSIGKFISRLLHLLETSNIDFAIIKPKPMVFQLLAKMALCQ